MTEEPAQLKVTPKQVRGAIGKQHMLTFEAHHPEDAAASEDEILFEGVLEDLRIIYPPEQQCEVWVERDADEMGDVEGLYPPDHEEAPDEEEMEEGCTQFEPTAAQKQSIIHLHDNLGHPPVARMMRMMRHAGVREDVVRWCKQHFRCDFCDRQRKPRPHIPSRHPSTFATNQIVGLDLVFLEWQGQEIIVIHALDYGSGYHQAARLESKEPREAFRFFLSRWIAFLGVPHLVITDSGGEFTGREFRVGSLGAMHYVTDARAPWQNGRTERGGAELKRHIRYVLDKIQPDTLAQVDECIAEAVLVRNQYCLRAGFSPLQRLFGYAPTAPQSLVSIAKQNSLLWEGPYSSLQRAEAVRQAALEAWTKAECSTRMHRALRTQHRVPPRPLEVGQWVRVWRQSTLTRGQWIGPGQI
eukprot:2625311-Amphidinium_carterae.1